MKKVAASCLRGSCFIFLKKFQACPQPIRVGSSSARQLKSSLEWGRLKLFTDRATGSPSPWAKLPSLLSPQLQFINHQQKSPKTLIKQHIERWRNNTKITLNTSSPLYRDDTIVERFLSIVSLQRWCFVKTMTLFIIVVQIIVAAIFSKKCSYLLAKVTRARERLNRGWREVRKRK